VTVGAREMRLTLWQMVLAECGRVTVDAETEQRVAVVLEQPEAQSSAGLHLFERDRRAGARSGRDGELEQVEVVQAAE
jgi:hypothetical protein